MTWCPQGDTRMVETAFFGASGGLRKRHELARSTGRNVDGARDDTQGPTGAYAPQRPSGAAVGQVEARQSARRSLQGPAVWGAQQADRQAVPWPGDAERPVQAPWRHEHRAADAGGARAEPPGPLDARQVFG